MIGAILDVYPEGEEAFRGCVCDVALGSVGGLWIINLKDGTRTLRFPEEYDKPVILNIFTFENTDEE